MLVISILPPHGVTAIPAIPGLLQHCRDFRGSSIIWSGGNSCMFSCSLTLAAPTDAPPPPPFFFFCLKDDGKRYECEGTKYYTPPFGRRFRRGHPMKKLVMLTQPWLPPTICIRPPQSFLPREFFLMRSFGASLFGVQADEVKPISVDESSQYIQLSRKRKNLISGPIVAWGSVIPEPQSVDP